MLAACNRFGNVIPERIAYPDISIPYEAGFAFITVGDLLVGKGKGPHRPGGKVADPAEVGFLDAERGEDFRCTFDEEPGSAIHAHNRGHPFPVPVKEILFCYMGFCTELHVIE